MPRVNCGFVDDATGPGWQWLQALGPTAPVDIGFDPTYEPQKSDHPPTPTATAVPALIDTGAVESMIDNALAQSLGLPLVDKTKVSGVGGVDEMSVYLGQVHLPQLGFTQYGRFVGANLSEGSGPHKVLLGRTLLRGMLLVYDGETGTVTLMV